MIIIKKKNCNSIVNVFSLLISVRQSGEITLNDSFGVNGRVLFQFILTVEFRVNFFSTDSTRIRSFQFAGPRD